MSKGLNRWCGIGNLGADAELRFTQGGQAVLNVRLACTTTYRDKDGKDQEQTEWVTCVVWGKRGEALAEYMTKGTKVYVEGKLRTTSYEKDGVTKYKTEINVDELELLDVRTKSDGGGSKPSERREEKPASQQSARSRREQPATEKAPWE